MVIDLTQDSESSDQSQPATFTPLVQPFTLRFSNSQLAPNPLKRKSERSGSENSSDSVPKRFISRKINGVHTPSPAASSSSGRQPISVVIPSPSIEQRKEIESAELIKVEPTGISQEYFPTNAYEEKADKGAYPAARKVNRSSTFLAIRPLPQAISTHTSINARLVATLRSKLSVIDGPKVSVVPKDELALALAVENFQFVNSYQLRTGVKLAPESFNSGCTCDAFCDPARCSCLELSDEQEHKIIPYRRSPDDPRTMLLSEKFLNIKWMIMECNSRCGCKGNCWNAVTRGRKVRLEIFHTGNRGFGLRSLDSIWAGQFIDRYLGEVITSKTAARREEAPSGKDGHSYLFSLDWNYQIDEDDPEYNDEGIYPYVVDGQKYGSPTRFMNHSCNPNCKIIPVSRNHGDEFIYDLAFFAVKDILPLTELTFDYYPDWPGDAKMKVDPNAVPCLCGEPNCRKQLWPNSRKGTK